LALLTILVSAIGKPNSAGPLTMGYFLALSLLHIPGALIYLDPNSLAPDRRETELGFQLTLIGMAALVAGTVVAGWSKRAQQNGSKAIAVIDAAQTFAPQAWKMVAIGLVGFFVLTPRAQSIPSGTALVSAISTLTVLGLWLRLYVIEITGKGGAFATLMLLPLLPLATLSLVGFVSFGIGWVVSVLGFFLVVSRLRLLAWFGAPLLGVFGISLFSIYLAVRSILRTVIWNAQTGLVERLQVIWQAVFNNFSLLDLHSPILISAVNLRLNANYMVGLGIERHVAGLANLAYGSTVEWWGLVPRALWPNKPAVGGGRDIVTNFTGVVFGFGTNVGVGQVLEFYINFAVPGVIVGFFLWGYVLRRLDFGIMQALKAGDMRRLLVCAMPGLTLMDPGGTLLTLLVAVIGALIVSRMLGALNVFGPPHAGHMPQPAPAE
jgi:hypothetical protein